MCFRNDLFSEWNQLELYSDWSLSPESDQHEFSLYNIKTLSREKVRRSNERGRVVQRPVKITQG